MSVSSPLAEQIWRLRFRTFLETQGVGRFLAIGTSTPYGIATASGMRTYCTKCVDGITRPGCAQRCRYKQVEKNILKFLREHRALCKYVRLAEYDKADGRLCISLWTSADLYHHEEL